jgi:hypothetical protein
MRFYIIALLGPGSAGVSPNAAYFLLYRKARPPGNAGVSPACLHDQINFLLKIHKSSRYFSINLEISIIRTCEPARRRRSQGRACAINLINMHQPNKNYAALGISRARLYD